MKQVHAKILIVDDDKTACDMLRDVLTGEGYAVTTALSGEEAVDIGAGEKFDVVITDLRMKELDGIDVLRAFQEKSPDTSIIVITAFGSMDSAVEAIQAGAYDYLSKPFKLDDIRLTVRRALERRVAKESTARVQEAAERFDDIIGQSPNMVEVYKIVARVANSQSTILVQGESGTGKELIARAIHMKSTRRDQPFVAINCGAISETLLESELFGHERGAFTGAVGLHKGIFEAAHGGTCFLDEISEMPMTMQAKLLRVLQDGEIRRVGSAHPIKIDTRIIAATNKDLESLLKAGSFREDLLYRLNAITITIPPLRERREDIPLLVDYFLKKYSARLGKPLVEISPQAMRILENYHWSGNVRELENVIERTVTLSPSGIIMPENLPERLRSPEAVPDQAHPFPANLTLKEIERKCIIEVLEKVGGNKSKAAAILGIDRKTLRAKIAEYKINNP
jgi:DNA-binding NtrC family response regulator